MVKRDRYPAGVPCWVDTSQPDPAAGAAFYGALFGWAFEHVMAPERPGSYFVARLHDGTVAAVSSVPEGAPPLATWNTYVAVDSADETAAAARAAGGRVLSEPFDVMDAGRMAVLADPDGAVFCVWQAKGHHGAEVVNEHGAVNFNDLRTRDAAGAKAFYGALFGWQALDLGGGAAMWTLPGYGDHLEELVPGTRERMASLGAPAGFEDVVASLLPIAADEPDVVAHWGVTFAVSDADAIAARAADLGGEVLMAPFDAPWVRMAVIRDPQGATFVASQFKPENKDMGAPAAERAGAA